DDLFQIGSIGLIKAIDKFDLSYDVRFSTYAVPMIIGEIQRFIRDDGSVKVSRSLKEPGNRIRRKKDELTKQLGRSPTVKEIADAL
ncbi:sigma factor, partial [Staphylococcus sp. SIMBA_130]